MYFQPLAQALGMAWQLEQAQQQVQLLVLDTAAPYHENIDFTLFTNPLWDAVGVIESLHGIDLGLSQTALAALADDELRYQAVMQRLQEQDVFYAPDTPVEELKRFVTLYQAMNNNYLLYAPEQQKVNHLTLFKAQERHAKFAGHLLKTQDWGWQAFSRKPIAIYETKGNHLTMLTKPHVNSLAERLKQMF